MKFLKVVPGSAAIGSAFCGLIIAALETVKLAYGLNFLPWHILGAVIGGGLVGAAAGILMYGLDAFSRHKKK